MHADIAGRRLLSSSRNMPMAMVAMRCRFRRRRFRDASWGSSPRAATWLRSCCRRITRPFTSSAWWDCRATRIQMKQGLLYINGVPVARERLPDFVGDEPCGSVAIRPRRSAGAKRFRTASAMRRSIASTMDFTTTPTSTRCRTAISSCWATTATIRRTVACFRRWAMCRWRISSVAPAMIFYSGRARGGRRRLEDPFPAQFGLMVR